MGGRSAAAAADAPLGELLTVEIRAAVAQLLAHETGLSARNDPDDVHRARVAIRRFRAVLHAFGDASTLDLDPGLHAELRWLARELGAVRDLEVLAGRLHRQASELDGSEAVAASRVLRRLDTAIDATRAGLAATMRDSRAHDLREALARVAARPPLGAGAAEPAGPALQRAVRRSWRRVARSVDRLGPEPSDEDLHRIRILAKRARYVAEAAEPVFGRRARRFARGMARVQDVLGEHQDAVIARQWLAGAATECSGAEAYALGLVAAAEAHAAASSRAAFPGTWRDAAAPDRRRWL